MNPTSWTINPLASTANIIEYDGSGVGGSTYSDASITYASSSTVYSANTTIGEQYDNASQPYDGTNNNPSLTSWKNPTAYTPLSVLYQQYYGGPTNVPLFAAPRHWDYNPGIFNEQGQYVSSLSGSADIYSYDGTNDAPAYSDVAVTYGSSTIAYAPANQDSQEYDNAERNYDGVNDGKSFYNWKSPTAWQPITGGSL